MTKDQASEVTCVRRRGYAFSSYERIDTIGGATAGKRWLHDETRAIANIEANPKAYFVRVRGEQIYLIVAIHAGRKYLKTSDDGFSPDSLLSLPPCPK